uniref:Uncharacterized protein n=1 Tax=Schizaphis graminum TaxID=13262 RepID=A0A2S2NAD0_SCHGA
MWSPPSRVTARIRLNNLRRSMRRLLRSDVLVTGHGHVVVSLLLLLFVQDVPDRLLFAALLLPAVYSQADAFDQLLGLVAVQRDELGCPAGAHVRVERPRLLSVESGRAQHVVLDEPDDAPVDRGSLQHHCGGKRRQQKRGRVHRRRSGGMHDDNTRVLSRLSARVTLIRTRKIIILRRSKIMCTGSRSRRGRSFVIIWMAA